MAYHTLIGITRRDDQAEPIFGSHLRSEVKFEMDEYNYNKRIAGKDSEYVEFHIIKTDGYMTAEVEAAIRDFMLVRRRNSNPIPTESNSNL
jgi:hypothetical protein